MVLIGVFILSKKKSLPVPDVFLIIVILSLLVIGLIMVYSASSAWATYKFQDGLYFAKRQLLFAGIGVGAMFFTATIHYQVWKKYAYVLLIACFGLLLLVLIPGVGLVRNGAQSWIGVGAFSIQPSEFIKFALICYLAKYCEAHRKDMPTLKRGLLPTLGLVFLAFGLIMLQPDLGTGAVMVATCMVVIFIAGASMKHYAMLALMGVLGFVGLVLSAPYRLERITSYLDPWSDPLDSGFQMIQSLYAIGPGGLFGLGLGESRQKFFYLPEPQTDFIFAIIGEELGFFGGLLVIGLFLLLLWRGIKIALGAPDSFSCLVASGIITMVTIQVIINIGVVTGLFPVTGITLPFLSYGGSSLTLTLATVGVLLNISRYAKM